jgi:hypothetical protein
MGERNVRKKLRAGCGKQIRAGRMGISKAVPARHRERITFASCAVESLIAQPRFATSRRQAINRRTEFPLNALRKTSNSSAHVRRAPVHSLFRR